MLQLKVPGWLSSARALLLLRYYVGLGRFRSNAILLVRARVRPENENVGSRPTQTNGNSSSVVGDIVSVRDDVGGV